MCVRARVSATLMLNSSETDRFRGSCLIRKVPMVCRLVTSSLTSLDSDIIFMMSQSSKSLHSETRTRIDYPC